MKEYLVVWSIHVTAENPEEAAKQADETRDEYDAKAYEVVEASDSWQSLNDFNWAKTNKTLVDVADLWENPEEDSNED